MLAEILLGVGVAGLATGFGGRYLFVLPVFSPTNGTWAHANIWGESAWTSPVWGTTPVASMSSQAKMYISLAFNLETSLGADEPGVALKWHWVGGSERTLAQSGYTLGTVLDVPYAYLFAGAAVAGLVLLVWDLV